MTEEASTRPLTQPEDDTSANIVCDTPSPPDAEAEMSDSEGDTEILNIGEEKGKDVSNTVALEERIVELDEGQAGSDPGNTLESRPPPDEDQAGSNPGPSHVALSGPNPEPMYEDFIATVYPKVYESLKHTTKEHVFLENPPSSFRTLSSMKNLDDAFTYGDQFLYDKPMEEELGKSNVETKVESMPKPVSPPIQEPIFIATTSTTTTLPPPPPSPQQQSTTDRALAARISALEQICANFEKKNKYINENVKEAVQDALQAQVRERFRELSEFEMKEIIRDRMFESGSYRSQREHTTLYDALEASIDHEKREEFMDATAKSRKRRRDDQDPPLPHLKDSNQSKKKRHDSDASASQQPQAQTPLAWKTTDTRDDPSSSSKQKPDSQSEQPIDDIPIPDDLYLSYSEDTDPEKNKLLRKTKDMGSFIKWYYKRIGKSKLTKADLEDKIDLTNLEGNWVVHDVSKPLPLGGPPGDKDRRHALLISKLKAAYYQDFRLKELVPSLWIESEHEYDVSAAYVRSHMKILSVISLKTFPRYGYTFLSEIILRRADFKNLHPNDFEDLYLLHLQVNLNHLSGADKVHLFNAVNLWIRNLVIRKQDYIIVHKPRAIIYKDKNDQKKMMWENEVHKFSDGMLTRILEKLDYMDKDFRLFKFNLGIENRIWSGDDKRRSKEFIEVIERRLKIRRIFRNLESFVSRRLRDVDYRLILRTE
ncbi:hypothetical protein Tco_0465494 [Tanacetum coccineum]